MNFDLGRGAHCGQLLLGLADGEMILLVKPVNTNFGGG